MSADRLLECQKFSQITYLSQERFFVKGWTSLSRSWGGEEEETGRGELMPKRREKHFLHENSSGPIRVIVVIVVVVVVVVVVLAAAGVVVESSVEQRHQNVQTLWRKRERDVAAASKVQILKNLSRTTGNNVRLLKSSTLIFSFSLCYILSPLYNLHLFLVISRSIFFRLFNLFFSSSPVSFNSLYSSGWLHCRKGVERESYYCFLLVFATRKAAPHLVWAVKIITTNR